MEVISKFLHGVAKNLLKRPSEPDASVVSKKRKIQNTTQLTFDALGDSLCTIFSFLPVPDLLSLKRVNKKLDSWLFSVHDWNWNLLLKEVFPFGHESTPFGDVVRIVHQMRRRSDQNIRSHLVAIPNILISESEFNLKDIICYNIPWQQEICVFQHAGAKSAFFINLLTGKLLWKSDCSSEIRVESISFDHENKKVGVLTSNRALNKEVTLYNATSDDMTAVDKFKTTETSLPKRFSNNFYFGIAGEELVQMSLSGEVLERFDLPTGENLPSIVLCDYAIGLVFIVNLPESGSMEILQFDIQNKSIKRSHPIEACEEPLEFFDCYVWQCDEGRFLIGHYEPYVWSVDIDRGDWTMWTIPWHLRRYESYTFSGYNCFVKGTLPKSENSPWPSSTFFERIEMGKMSDGSVTKQIDATANKWKGCKYIIDEKTILLASNANLTIFDWQTEKVIAQQKRQLDSLDRIAVDRSGVIKSKALLWELIVREKGTSRINVICRQIKCLL